MILERYHQTEQNNSPSPLSSAPGKRKTDYTVVAAYYKGEIVPLYSARANQIARRIILPALFPNLSDLRAEVKHENSRVDFFFSPHPKKHPQNKAFLEVKACTLIEEGIAMFPDTPTERGKKHLKELAHAITENIQAHVIFVIMNPTAKTFVPNIHTDPEFAKLVFQLKEKIKFHAISIKTNRSGNVTIANKNLPIDFHLLEKFFLQNPKINTLGGIYMLNIEIEKETERKIGSLGKINFKRGFYIYVGSAMKNLESRIKRHKRKTKKLRWHIDYLTSEAKKIIGYPIITRKQLECSLAQAIKRIAQDSIPNFGASDCNCDSHLFYFPENPELTQDFIDILFHFRHKAAF